jgi:hypothetical protein
VRRSAFIALLACFAAPARAHIGATVANASFTSPAGPMVTSDKDFVTVTAPYSFATADQSFTVAWEDGDLDPSGRFQFYFIDHQLNFQTDPSTIPTIGTPAVGAPADGIYAGCNCDQMTGLGCDSGVRDCRNSFSWDTSALQPGAYWVVTVNNDPPYFQFSSASGPVRVAHGGSPPPAAVIVRPDGYGSHVGTYKLQWVAAGDAPLKFDLSYGVATPEQINDPPLPLASDLSPAPGTDGTYAYDWDLSALADTIYFVRLKTTDGSGRSTSTDSYFGVTVYHARDMGKAPDMGTKSGGKGCGGCDVGTPDAGSAATIALVIAAALALLLFSSRASRGAGRRPPRS